MKSGLARYFLIRAAGSISARLVDSFGVAPQTTSSECIENRFTVTSPDLAEGIRGGLQALPKGQAEAADALGVSYWKKTGFIILPQALRLVIPPLVNTFIGMFKDTSLVVIVSLFDLLGATEFALTDSNWQGFAVEADVFIALIYWSFCFFMSRYSLMLEREFNRGKRR